MKTARFLLPLPAAGAACAATLGLMAPLLAWSPRAEGDDARTEYTRALAMLESTSKRGKAIPLDSAFFSSLNWVGRTATINYVCGTESAERCRDAVLLGLIDNALVVRDHALRVMLSTRHFPSQERKSAAEQVISDDRNYRKGRPFWIVDRAKSYLAQADTTRAQ